MTDFIGRGEERTVEILKYLFPKHNIYQQYPIKDLLDVENYQKLGTEYNKHKHDIVLEFNWQWIVIEVNYNHGSVAEAKWLVYKSYLENAGHTCVTIDDNECESLFQLKDGEHKDTWQDWIDVINALDNAGVKVK